ncbi:MAG: hypothetical protein FWC70_10515 [Defluviitaleaceae bacterium]|nr:hypothetical protein [Defluviitaleaceae bacterium]
MTKRERLENMRREHARERNETREDEMYRREGEEFTIQTIRESMTRVLGMAEISPEERKEQLARLKDEIDEMLDARDEREYSFIERELEHHRLEQEIAQEIELEEKKSRPPSSNEVLPLVRPLITASAEQMRKEIEEKRRRLNEDEQCSTILLSTSERDIVPQFAPRRRIRKREEPVQIARIDSLVLKQREISLMYHESQELQKSMLKKPKNAPAPKPEEIAEVADVAADVNADAELTEIPPDFEDFVPPPDDEGEFSE